MIIPKEVIDEVCSKCKSWGKGPYLDYKVNYCHSYARDCDNLMMYAFRKNKENHEKNSKKQQGKLFK